MLIQDQFNKWYFKTLLERLITQKQGYTLFLKNQKKQSQNFTKEQQKFFENKYMVEYNKANVKSSISQQNKLKTPIKNETGLALRMNIKMFNGKHFFHEVLLTTKQTTNFRNAIEINMSIDISCLKLIYRK